MQSPKNYHIFGNGISQSLSPLLHNTAFKHYGLPHRYTLQESGAIEDVESFMQHADFGGASVTMPHKLAVHKYCHDQSDSAKLIGAINTLVVTGSAMHDGRRLPTLSGHNTDWSGLYSIVDTHTAPKGPIDGRVGLVIGAGGAARAALYALYQAKVQRIYIWNRTIEKARKIQQDFADVFHVSIVDNLSQPPESIDIIIGTIPAEATEEGWFENLFKNRDTGVCIEMSYKPRVTPLISMAKRQGSWFVADGVEVLLQQAFAQFTLWTAMPAPQDVMRNAVSESVKL